MYVHHRLEILFSERILTIYHSDEGFCLEQSTHIFHLAPKIELWHTRYTLEGTLEVKISAILPIYLAS